MKFILASPNKELHECLTLRFSDCPEVEVVQCYFEEIEHFDCIITAGNSFGLMDAGVDKAVVKFFGIKLMERIQQKILLDYLGEQPVGSCIIVETGNYQHPFVAHAPTMRVPMNISRTDNVYVALWSSLIAVHKHNLQHEKKIETLVCPALGTGTGGMGIAEAALQMYLAYTNYKTPAKTINGSVAQLRHESVHYGGNWGFQNPRK